MKRIIISLLAASMLAGCAGASIEQTSLRTTDGTKMYILKEFMYSEGNRERTIQQLAERANHLCKSGYELLNEDQEQIKTAFGTNAPGIWKLHWQIQCNKSPF